MKKILSIILAALLAFGAFSVLSFAEEREISRTEQFIASVDNGIAAKISGDIDATAAIKGSKAAFSLKIPYINVDAKAVADGKTVKAYAFKLFGDLYLAKIDATDFIKEIYGDFDIAELTGFTQQIKEYDVDEILDYCTYTKDGKYDRFVINEAKVAEELKPVIVEKIVDGQLKSLVEGYSADDFISFCKGLKPGDIGYEEYQTVTQCGGTVTFSDETGKTITAVDIKYPSEDFKTVKTLNLATIFGGGIKIDYVSIDVSESAFKQPIGIFGFNWVLNILKNYL